MIDDEQTDNSSQIANTGNTVFAVNDVVDGEEKQDEMQQLRTKIKVMRSEADRIAGMQTGDDQVELAEKFADDIARIDEEISATARAADEDAHS